MKSIKKSSIQSDYLYEDFSQRINKKYLFCFQSSNVNLEKFERIHNYCQKQGFIFDHSTIDIIRKSFSNIFRTTLDSNRKKKFQTTHNLKLQFTHINTLPNRTEQGLFLIIELGNLLEDVRYSLVSLLGKHVPSYEILHSRGYNLSEQIRHSHGTILIDYLVNGLKNFLNQIKSYSSKETLSQYLPLGLLIHFPMKFIKFNYIKILSWSNRFNCPDLLEKNIIDLFHRSFKYHINNYQLTIIACLNDNLASLISVAFEYPNTFLSLTFSQKFQLSFLEHMTNEVRYRTILSFDFQSIHSKNSNQIHALFQTILTPIDIYLIEKLHINYFDIFTCDFCLLEIFRLLIIELSIHEQFLSNTNINQLNSIDFKFIFYLLQNKYSKLKIYLNKLKKIHFILMKYLIHILIRRSTQILSCLIVCLTNQYNKEDLTIAIDSYLYRLCPIYAYYLHQEIEYLCKHWITTFRFVIPTNKSYLGPAVLMSLQKTINKNANRLCTTKKIRRQI